MTETTFAATRPLSPRFERNLALIFGLLGLILTILIGLHWSLVLEPTLRSEAESRSSALAQAQAQGIEKLLGGDVALDRLQIELQTALDAILLLKDRSTGAPFIRGIKLIVDYDLIGVPSGSLDVALGEDKCADCFVAQIPLYHPRNHQLVGIATCYSSPQFLEQLVRDVRIKLLWLGGTILGLIGFAWWESNRLLRRLGESESNLRNIFEAAPFPMMLIEADQGGLRQINRAAKAYLALSEDQNGRFSSESWRALHASGLPNQEEEPREMPILDVDGTLRWALVSTIPLRFSGAPSRLISLVDVSDMKKIQDELRAASFTDSLTGLYNRRYLFSRLISEIDLVNRYGHPLSVILFDLDHFKSINDTYGHGVGDEVLIQIAVVLRACIREVDVAGRYGGEEFLVILPHADAAKAKDIAERIRITLKTLKWPQPRLRVTVSAGVQEYSVESLDEFVEAADRKLYQAKEGGRDRVV
ncbi:GGDEF domain-containing protein [Thiocystis violascens]|uniref:diguanylate cyclase n=1 Tax=Thiocystis violascens (strain ATCC 17096 / DSM 198 / 6111) TaxID=765911 RepID=I3YBS3_THIV6|nr:sensor domain-containing diguanylate cyclase [Thiocystis violascens]AFL74441.1 diguanylate cyclase (GGDEF) domain-containing protein [Thiocystis violascens DSM 198]